MRVLHNIHKDWKFLIKETLSELEYYDYLSIGDKIMLIFVFTSIATIYPYLYFRYRKQDNERFIEQL